MDFSLVRKPLCTNVLALSETMKKSSVEGHVLILWTQRNIIKLSIWLSERYGMVPTSLKKKPKPSYYSQGVRGPGIYGRGVFALSLTKAMPSRVKNSLQYSFWKSYVSYFLGTTKCLVYHICFQLHITSVNVPHSYFRGENTFINEHGCSPPVPFPPQTFKYAHQLLLTVQKVGSVYPPSFLSYSARSCGSLKASLFICCVVQSLTLGRHAKRKPISLFPVVLIGRARCLPLH